MTEEIQILRQYADTRSQEAFAELVRRYVDLVYSCAKRQVGGDAHLAEDVTQSTFLLLAQKAEHVPTDRPLSSWLVKAAGYFAANARRARERRFTHEQKAAQMAPSESEPIEPEFQPLSPMLDLGISKLPREYRDALLLRFFEKKSLRQIGQTLGVSEEAAQKRVSRAVDKLREFFVGRGVTTISAAALAALLTNESVNAAPAELAATVVSAAGATAAGVAAAAVPVKMTLFALLTQKVKIAAIVGMVLALGIGGAIAMDGYGSRRTSKSVTPAPSPARAPARTPANWIASFSDGTKVEVLALTDPSKNNQWWALDGSPTVDPKFRAAGTINMTYKLARRIDLVVHLTGAALDKKSLTVRSDAPSRSATLANGSTTNRFVRIYIPVPMGAASGNLRVGLAGGAWTSELNLPCANGEDPPAGSSGAGLAFEEIVEEPGGTLVRMNTGSLLELQSEDREVIVMLGGKELRPAATISSGSRFTYTFHCKRSDVTQIIARSRPYQWIEMKNVAFAPSAEATAVAVSSSAIPAPQTAATR
jgi:RNA polymerase sigma factor (sigma-70 family)